MTNGEWMRTLTDEQLGVELCNKLDCPGCPFLDLCGWNTTEKNGAVQWLKQERVEE